MDNSIDSKPLPFQAVIFATDFSAGSQNAGNYASLLARRLGAELVVAHSFLLSNSAMEVEAESGPAVKSQQRKDLETSLAAVATKLGVGLERTATVLVEGDPREVIPRLAREYAPSLTILGTEGRGRVSRGIVGSVAERILRACDGPCLTIGPQVHACESASFTLRRVLYATGLSPAAARGAAYAAALAQTFDASLDVLHVVNPEDADHPGGLHEIRRRFEAALTEMVPRQVGAFLNPQAVVEIGTAHDQILHRARESQADMLVLSLRKSGHLWLASRLSGAFHIIANAPCPVLTITG